MASSPTSTRSHSPDVPSLEEAERCPFFGGDISNWSALQPTEQAEVILAAYQERVLPELGQMERLLTHLAVEYGLEYCRLDELAVFYLEVAREIRDHVRSLELTVAASTCHEMPCQWSGWADTSPLIERLQSLIQSCDANGMKSPCYARLLDGLRKCEFALSELLILEAALTQDA